MTTTKNAFTAQDSQRDGVGGRKFSKARSVAERLGICPRTIFRWADGGKITRHKVNVRLFATTTAIPFVRKLSS